MGGGAFGYSHTTGGYDGGQAQYVRVPFGDVGPMKIPGGRGADVCIDAVGCEASGSLLQRALGLLKLQAGTATGIQWAIETCRRGGNVVLIGVYGPPRNMIPVGTAMNKGLTLRMGQ